MNIRRLIGLPAIHATSAALLLMLAGAAWAYIPPVNKPVAPATASRAAVPLHAVTGTASGQAGYVHFFLLRLPDDAVEMQVGIELADQRIAWSFPDLGVTVTPFIASGTVDTGRRVIEVWHLYGLRPFPDDTAMKRLRRELPARVERWLKAGLPYCLDDGPRNQCISCLGLVMRTLFPGRSGYPNIPPDFWRARADHKYTPNDLLLYLSGMLELNDRSARLQRLDRQVLPPDLRDDLEELIYGIGAGETTAATARQKRASGLPRVNPASRRRL